MYFGIFLVCVVPHKVDKQMCIVKRSKLSCISIFSGKPDERQDLRSARGGVITTTCPAVHPTCPDSALHFPVLRCQPSVGASLRPAVLMNQVNGNPTARCSREGRSVCPSLRLSRLPGRAASLIYSLCGMRNDARADWEAESRHHPSPQPAISYNSSSSSQTRPVAVHRTVLYCTVPYCTELHCTAAA